MSLVAMDLIEEVGVSELLQAQAHVSNHMFNYVSSMSLKCAVQLGIPDIIHNHGRPMTLSKLVDALMIDPAKMAHVQRLMHLLVHSGFFTLQKNGDHKEEEDEGYVLTPSSKILLSECTMSMSPLLLLVLEPVIIAPWHCLSKWFRGSESTAFETGHGVKIWEYMAQSPDINNMFNRGMASDSRLVMNILVKECGVAFQGLQSIVDVGGGTGYCAVTIAEAFPDIKCTVFDLPHVVATATKDTKVDFIGGDMFKAIPKADAVFLKLILHDWSDEECIKILRRCKEAIPSKEEGGKVIIVDIVVNTKHDDHKWTETKLYYDLQMMVGLGGKERNECEWRKIIIDAGFTQYKITPVLGLRSVIEVYP